MSMTYDYFLRVQESKRRAEEAAQKRELRKKELEQELEYERKKIEVKEGYAKRIQALSAENEELKGENKALKRQLAECGGDGGKDLTPKLKNALLKIIAAVLNEAGRGNLDDCHLVSWIESSLERKLGAEGNPPKDDFIRKTIKEIKALIG